jgi:hypothetical protein
MKAKKDPQLPIRIQIVFDSSRGMDNANILETYLRADWSGMFEPFLLSAADYNYDPYAKAMIMVMGQTSDRRIRKGNYVEQTTFRDHELVFNIWSDERKHHLDVLKKTGETYTVIETQSWTMLSELMPQVLKTLHYYTVVAPSEQNKKVN